MDMVRLCRVGNYSCPGVGSICLKKIFPGDRVLGLVIVIAEYVPLVPRSLTGLSLSRKPVRNCAYLKALATQNNTYRIEIRKPKNDHNYTWTALLDYSIS